MSINSNNNNPFKGIDWSILCKENKFSDEFRKNFGKMLNEGKDQGNILCWSTLPVIKNYSHEFVCNYYKTLLENIDKNNDTSV